MILKEMKPGIRVVTVGQIRNELAEVWDWERDNVRSLLQRDSEPASYERGKLAEDGNLLGEFTNPLQFGKVEGVLRGVAGFRRVETILQGGLLLAAKKGEKPSKVTVSDNVKLTIRYLGEITQGEYALRMADHGFETALDRSGVLKEIKFLWESGKSEAEIIKATAKSAGVVQPALRAIKLARVIPDAVERYVDKTLRLADVNALSKLMGEGATPDILREKFTKMTEDKGPRATRATAKDVTAMRDRVSIELAPIFEWVNDTRKSLDVSFWKSVKIVKTEETK